MRYDFCTDIIDLELGIKTIVDFECEVEISLDAAGGPVVDGVYLEGKSLLAGDVHSKWLGKLVADAAERNLETGGWLVEKVMDAEGIVYRGLGGTDPDDHYALVA